MTRAKFLAAAATAALIAAGGATAQTAEPMPAPGAEPAPGMELSPRTQLGESAGVSPAEAEAAPLDELAAEQLAEDGPIVDQVAVDGEETRTQLVEGVGPEQAADLTLDELAAETLDEAPEPVVPAMVGDVGARSQLAANAGMPADAATLDELAAAKFGQPVID